MLFTTFDLENKIFKENNYATFLFATLMKISNKNKKKNFNSKPRVVALSRLFFNPLLRVVWPLLVRFPIKISQHFVNNADGGVISLGNTACSFCLLTGPLQSRKNKKPQHHSLTKLKRTQTSQATRKRKTLQPEALSSYRIQQKLGSPPLVWMLFARHKTDFYSNLYNKTIP